MGQNVSLVVNLCRNVGSAAGWGMDCEAYWPTPDNPVIEFNDPKITVMLLEYVDDNKVKQYELHVK